MNGMCSTRRKDANLQKWTVRFSLWRTTQSMRLIRDLLLATSDPGRNDQHFSTILGKLLANYWRLTTRDVGRNDLGQLLTPKLLRLSKRSLQRTVRQIASPSSLFL